MSTRTLQLGMRGEDVQQLQRQLGFKKEDQDGKFGPNTLDAVTKVQQAAHTKTADFKVDGKVGKDTRKLLKLPADNEVPAKPVPPAPQQRPSSPPAGTATIQPPVQANTASPTAERDAVVNKLKDAGFVEVPKARGDTADVIRLRGQIKPYSQPVNIFVPPNYHQDANHASLNLHLHGFNANDGHASVQSSVFDKGNFGAMLAASGSRAALVVPESLGKDKTYQDEWMGPGGAGRFDTFMQNVASTMGYKGLSDRQTLSSHSGAGWIGDRVVRDTKFGEKVRYRGQFDDGYGHSGVDRSAVDKAIVARGGSVFAIANVGTGAAKLMNSHAPTVKRSELDALTPRPGHTELHVTGSTHFGLLELLPKLWGMAQPK